MNKQLRRSLGCLLCALPAAASANNGIYTHGDGIKSQGFGGVTVAAGEDSGSMVGNPANLSALGNRFDVGLEDLVADAAGEIVGNAAGSDERYPANGKKHYFIPQFGFVKRLGSGLSGGMSMASAGLGPNYRRSPFERFGGERSARIALAQSSLVTALSYDVAPSQVLGVSVNLAYQMFELEGVGALSAASASPQRFSDQGTEGVFGVGFTVGWSGRLAPWLTAGAAYRSKTWTERMERYEGLIADRGRLETPAMYSGGVVLAPSSRWKLGLEAMRVEYASQIAFGNDLSELEQGHRFGSEDGPGFGWRDQNIYKLGVAYQATPALTLRAGYCRATQLIPNSSTFLSMLGPATTKTHYSLGATYERKGWELSTYGTLGERRRIEGENSIPASFGGGEANLDFRMIGVGLALGRHLGD